MTEKGDLRAPGRPKQVAVVGAGVAGLTTALLLSRDGHEVTLVEQDRLDRADATDRPGTPQARQSHAFMGRLRRLLAAELPDVLADLHAAGATDYQILDDLPDTIDDRSPRPGDEDLVLLACRRATFEAVLRRAALASPGVCLIDATAVEGLELADATRDPSPTVTGLRLRGRSGERRGLAADVVISAGGSRSPVPTWLEESGVKIREMAEESGILYLTRFYRHLEDDDRSAGHPSAADDTGTAGGLGLLGADLGYLKCAIFRGDNDSFSVTFAPRSSDQELRTALRDPDGFQRACTQFRPIAPWVAPQRAEPVTDVHAMARLGNRQRRFLDKDGQPLIRGFHAVGDAHTSTNPLYGRGCSLAVLQATLLRQALRDHPDDPTARAVAYEVATAAEIEPWYHTSVAQDQFNRMQAEAARAAKENRTDGGTSQGTNGDGESSGELDGPAFFGKVVREGLLPASRTDAVVARAFLRVINVLQTPESLFNDADVTSRILQTMANPAAPELLPDYRVRRVDLLAAIT